MPDQPGWYPDPARPDHARWFDGSRWSAHVRAATPPPVPVGAAQRTVPGWEPPEPLAPPHLEPSQGNMITGNLFSLLSAFIAVVCVIALAQGRLVFIGLLPIGFALTGYKLRERLAMPALVLAFLAFIANFVIR